MVSYGFHKRKFNSICYYQKQFLTDKTCNHQLGEGIERGTIQLFDCPPLIFSPNEVDDSIKKVHFDIPGASQRDHLRLASNEDSEKKLQKPSILFQIANMTP